MSYLRYEVKVDYVEINGHPIKYLTHHLGDARQMATKYHEKYPYFDVHILETIPKEIETYPAMKKDPPEQCPCGHKGVIGVSDKPVIRLGKYGLYQCEICGMQFEALNPS